MSSKLRGKATVEPTDVTSNPVTTQHIAESLEPMDSNQSDLDSSRASIEEFMPDIFEPNAIQQELNM